MSEENDKTVNSFVLLVIRTKNLIRLAGPTHNTVTILGLNGNILLQPFQESSKVNLYKVGSRKRCSRLLPKVDLKSHLPSDCETGFEKSTLF
uniref:Uncharacterized protein n=1 Tax=Romanomermis culicivorax TaxID=13658 RepID=A0A915L0A1_ROMCU